MVYVNGQAIGILQQIFPSDQSDLIFAVVRQTMFRE